MARVLLIRHCQSTGQSTDSPLTELGCEQAVALAAWLAGRGVDRIVSSPYQRAIDTVLPFASRAGMEVETDERLGERRLGVWFDSVDAHKRCLRVRTVMEDRDQRYERRRDRPRGHGARLAGGGGGALAGSNSVTRWSSHGQMSSHLLGTSTRLFRLRGSGPP